MSVTRITANVMNTMRSRPGNGSPALVASGSESATASEMTPRMPAQPITNSTGVAALAVGTVSPSTASTLRDTTAVASTHSGRVTITRRAEL